MKFLVLLTALTLSFNVFAAKLNSARSLKSDVLTSISKDWASITEKIYKRELKNGANDYDPMFDVTKLSFKAKKGEKNINTAKQIWYRMTSTREYDAEVDELTGEVTAENLKWAIEDAIVAWSGDDIYVLPAHYNVLKLMANKLNQNSQIKVYKIEQSFSDGVFGGFVLLDTESEEAVLLNSSVTN